MTTVVPGTGLVPGDLVLLEAGNLVPADLRLTEATHLRIEEAPLTGESHAIDKITDALADPDLVLGDRATWRTRARRSCMAAERGWS
jgi:Ca2+-transporting ATPase